MEDITITIEDAVAAGACYSGIVSALREVGMLPGRIAAISLAEAWRLWPAHHRFLARIERVARRRVEGIDIREIAAMRPGLLIQRLGTLCDYDAIDAILALPRGARGHLFVVEYYSGSRWCEKCCDLYVQNRRKFRVFYGDGSATLVRVSSDEAEQARNARLHAGREHERIAREAKEAFIRERGRGWVYQPGMKGGCRWRPTRHSAQDLSVSENWVQRCALPEMLAAELDDEYAAPRREPMRRPFNWTRGRDPACNYA